MLLPRRAPRALAPSLAWSLAAPLLLGGCIFAEMAGIPTEPVDPTVVREVPVPEPEPQRIVVRHVQISFEGTRVRGATRTEEEARRLAESVLRSAWTGYDFAELVRLYSDDRHPEGRYLLVNWGILPEDRETSRADVPRAFGDVAFTLRPGEVALVPYDAQRCASGYHVVRRDQ